LNPNVEMIAQLRTDVLLMSPFEGASYGLLEKTGIPIVECADYMETSALGRAEWMKFYGMLVGREAEANQLFAEVRDNYNSLKSLASHEKKHPKLLADLLSGNTWYMPGGGSCYGVLFKDAGADYSIASDKVSGSQPLSQESVLLGGRDADVWMIKYSRPQDFTYSSLLQENAIYNEFAPFRQHHIYGCNALLTPFYEEVPFRPDILLKDVISILYPHLLPDYQPIFYHPLAE
ncbi:MAG: ABC transporter substrate-binding protein, partial [Bacteroidaceae bacterium]|nr:ABC transporter substrate-binding protein [Bacteroidaceae bacterium]